MMQKPVRQTVQQVSGTQRVAFQRYHDARGSLLPIEFNQLPFQPKRLFTVAGMPAGTVRGEHGHLSGQQLLICLHGQIDLLLRHGSEEAHASLVPDEAGLLIDSGVWCRQTYVTEGSVLLVLASESYSPDTYFYHLKEKS